MTLCLQEFAVPNCVEGATYDPWKALSDVTTYHNYRWVVVGTFELSIEVLLQRRKPSSQLKMCQMPKNLFVRRLPDGDAVLLVRHDGALLLPVHAAGGAAGVQVRRPRAHLPPAHRRLHPQDSGTHTDLLREPSNIFIPPPCSRPRSQQ